MNWWIFGLSCGLALQAVLLGCYAHYSRRAFDQTKSIFLSLIGKLEKRVDAAYTIATQALEGMKMLSAVDVGVLRDSGWLICCAKINGHDWVKIQALRPMKLVEYQQLMERLAIIGAEFQYVDAPIGAREFLIPQGRKW